MDCLLVENPIKGFPMDLHSKSIKCNKRSPAFSSFKEKECRAFYCIYFYFKLPHNTSKKLLRKEQIQLIVVHARRILVPHAALIPHAGASRPARTRAARTCAAPHRSCYADQRPDTPCPRSPPPALPPLDLHNTCALTISFPSQGFAPSCRRFHKTASPIY